MPTRPRSKYLVAAGVLSATVGIVIIFFVIVLVRSGGVAFAVSLASLLAAVLIFAYFGRSDSRSIRVAVTAGATTLVAFGLVLPVAFYLISGPASGQNPQSASATDLVSTSRSQSPTPPSQSPTPPSITVEITGPTKSTTCTNPPTEDPCLFSTTGKSKGVTNKKDLWICVLVYPVQPSGAGWYLQGGETTLRPDGTWSKVAQIGATGYPAHKGDTFRIMALVISKNAMIDGTRLDKRALGTPIEEPGHIAPNFAKSKIIDLTVMR
jgi:hypothetical protein